MSSRLRSLERVFLVAELLRSDRKPLSTECVHREVCRHMKQELCSRTTRRDLLLLERLGWVEQRRRRWCWVGPNSLIEQTPGPSSMAG